MLEPCQRPHHQRIQWLLGQLNHALLSHPVPLAREVKADRWADRSTTNRDLIDLGMMVHHWGAIPPEAWLKAESAYGDSVKRAYNAARQQMAHAEHLTHCLSKMAMDAQWSEPLKMALDIPT